MADALKNKKKVIDAVILLTNCGILVWNSEQIPTHRFTATLKFNISSENAGFEYPGDVNGRDFSQSLRTSHEQSNRFARAYKKQIKKRMRIS